MAGYQRVTGSLFLAESSSFDGANANVFHFLQNLNWFDWSYQLPELLFIISNLVDSLDWTLHYQVHSSYQNWLSHGLSFENGNSPLATSLLPFFNEFAGWAKVSHKFVMFSVHQHFQFFTSWVSWRKARVLFLHFTIYYWNKSYLYFFYIIHWFTNYYKLNLVFICLILTNN